jgi:hypothetical protein
MSNTPNLALPYIEAAQAQKHVTHNEAIRTLDALVFLTVLDRDLAAPPGSPADGARYLIAASPTGAWTGHATHIAVFQDGAWAIHIPKEGWVAWIADENVLLGFDGSDWGGITSGSGPLQNVPLLGVNTTADATNKLAVASAATLFNIVGNGHQLKINKAAAADTGSLLYQTAFSGRAEMGLAGDDDFRIKVSSNGTTWQDAIVIARATGAVSLPNSPAAGSPIPNVIVEDQKASGTSSGAFNSGAWRTRDLNTLVRNEGGIASLAANEVTLPPGTYYMRWSAPAYIVNAHQTRLFNVTSGAAVALGQCAYANSANADSNLSHGSAVATVSATTAFRLEHRCATTRATNGFGVSAALDTEIFSRLEIWKA